MQERMEGLIPGEVKNYPIFVASDITIAPEAAIEFYKKIRDTCNRAIARHFGEKCASFLPLDFVDHQENESVSCSEAARLVLSKVNLAELGVFYLGFNSTDIGMMLGRAKVNHLPVIFLYEVEKESELKRREPKNWWRVKNREELQFAPPSGVITPNSYESFMVPESLYDRIHAEIIFRKEEEGLSKLEQEVDRFFAKIGKLRLL